jgi:two-component system NarL family sensor kinase
MPEPTADRPPTPEVDAIVLEHAYRGVRLQMRLRLLLVVFVVLTVIIIPPVSGLLACVVVIAGYLLWSIGLALWERRGGASLVRRAWLALFVDLLVLAVLTVLTGVAAQQSWTSDVLIHGMFLIPVLAATQLRPMICTAVVVPTVAVYVAASVVTQAANDEPASSIALRTLVLIGVGVGCVALSEIQRSRVATIGGLVHDRTSLLAELVGVESRERRDLSEHLHDGALQYVLAARQDLADLRTPGDGASSPAPDVVDRVEHALTESSRMLRSTITDLHPAVLQQAGLARAVRELADAASSRAGFAVEVDDRDWPDDLRTPHDALLYGAARELLTNVVKHASASTVRVTLGRSETSARLLISDDGRGIAPEDMERALAAGHIGLRSHQLRVEAAGGTFTLAPARPTGTTATVEVPLSGTAGARPASVGAAGGLG